jgi:hypothetical protein
MCSTKCSEKINSVWSIRLISSRIACWFSLGSYLAEAHFQFTRLQHQGLIDSLIWLLHHDESRAAHRYAKLYLIRGTIESKASARLQTYSCALVSVATYTAFPGPRAPARSSARCFAFPWRLPERMQLFKRESMKFRTERQCSQDQVRFDSTHADGVGYSDDEVQIDTDV